MLLFMKEFVSILRDMQRGGRGKKIESGEEKKEKGGGEEEEDLLLPLMRASCVGKGRKEGEERTPKCASPQTSSHDRIFIERERERERCSFNLILIIYIGALLMFMKYYIKQLLDLD